MKQVSLDLINRELTSLTVWIEPEAADFWMAPGEEFQLTAETNEENGRFEIEHRNGSLVIFPSEGVGCIKVQKDGIELDCGYGRPSKSK